MFIDLRLCDVHCWFFGRQQFVVGVLNKEGHLQPHPQLPCRAIFSHTHSYQGHLQPHPQLPCRAIFSHTHSYHAGPSSATPTVTMQGHLQPHPQLPCRAIFSHTYLQSNHICRMTSVIIGAIIWDGVCTRPQSHITIMLFMHDMFCTSHLFFNIGYIKMCASNCHYQLKYQDFNV